MPYLRISSPVRPVSHRIAGDIPVPAGHPTPAHSRPMTRVRHSRSLLCRADQQERGRSRQLCESGMRSSHPEREMAASQRPYSCTVPTQQKSRFMLRGSAVRGWSRRRRLHDSPLANQATYIPHAAKPCSNTCPPGTAAACLRFACRGLLDTTSGVGPLSSCPPVHRRTLGN